MAERELVELFLTLQREFAARVRAVGAEQWSGETPNVLWNVSDLVAHLITEHLWVDPLMRGLEMDAAADEVDRARSFEMVDGLDATYVQAWGEASALSAAAFSAPGALGCTVSLSRGVTPASGYIRELIFDLIVHAWDLGESVGYRGELPADVVRTVWTGSQRFGDLSASGLFDHPVAISADAPVLDRLVAMTGRDPRWRESVDR